MPTPAPATTQGSTWDADAVPVPPMNPAGFLLDRVDHKPAGSGWLTLCPAHPDREASLSIGVGDEGRVLLHCHAGCELDVVLHGLHLTKTDLFPDREGRRLRSIYDYEDSRYDLVRQVLRYEPKSFRQRRPDGNGGWAWNVDGVADTLYRQPRLKDKARVFVVEGERDADRLWSLDLPATTNAGGAGRWRDAHTAQLVEAGVPAVVILPDQDEPGRRHAEAVARSCHAVGLRVQVLPLPGLTEKQDVSDWLDAGHDRAELLALAEASPAWEPPIEAQSPASEPTCETATTTVTVPEDEPKTDVGNAHRLVARYGDDLRYVPRWRTWLVWDGQRWQKDSMNRVTHFAKETIRALYRDAATAPGHESRELAKHAIKSEASGRIAAMVQLAESDPSIVVAPEALDADPFRLTVSNGTLDLRTGILQPHRREDLSTKLAPVPYDPEATCPLWLATLDRIMPGDTAQIAFVQKALGYALTGDASEQCFFLLYGRGANGKSTVIEVLRAVMGDYAMATAPETLLAKSTSGGANNDIAMLQGARFVSAVETDQGRRIAEALVKQATGGDRLTARFLYGEYFEFPPTFKLFLATNHKPVIRGTDHAMWRRVRLIPFEVQIPEQQQDRYLASKIKAAELPGVLNWLIAGCRAWQTEGLTPPERVLAATAEYREEQDVLGRFLGEACEESPAAVTLGKDLYAAYEQWCRDVGERPLTMREFNAVLDERGTFARDKGKQGVRWYGLAVNPAYLPLSRLTAAYGDQR